MGSIVDPRRVVWGASANVPILTLQGNQTVACLSWQICPRSSSPAAAIVSQTLARIVHDLIPTRRVSEGGVRSFPRSLVGLVWRTLRHFSGAMNNPG